MFLISNCCVGAGIYKNCLKQAYNNPFMWNLINFDSMYTLISEFDRINFLNYKLVKYKDANNGYAILIDDKVLVKYVHYRFNASAKKPVVKGVDVYFNKIETYIKNKYIERVNKMLKLNEKPIFIVGSVIKDQLYTLEEIEKICKIKTDCKIIIANDNIVLPNYSHIQFYQYKKPRETYGISNCLLGKELYDAFLK